MLCPGCGIDAGEAYSHVCLPPGVRETYRGADVTHYLCPRCGEGVVAGAEHACMPAAPFAEAIGHLTDGPPNKERALAAICRILDRLDKDDQHRVVDALVALGAG